MRLVNPPVGLGADPGSAEQTRAPQASSRLGRISAAGSALQVYNVHLNLNLSHKRCQGLPRVWVCLGLGWRFLLNRNQEKKWKTKVLRLGR